MPRKQKQNNAAKKRPFAADEGFPRKCNHCAKKEVVFKKVSYVANVRHDGRDYSFKVPKLEIMVCSSCEEKVFTEDVDRQINAAMRKHIGLMSPVEIRDGIRRIGMSQKQVAECIGIAEATLSRWLNETQIQSRSMDNLFRMFFAFPRARKILSADEPNDMFGMTEFPQQSSLDSQSLFNWDGTGFERLEECRNAQQLVSSSGSLWATSERQAV